MLQYVLFDSGDNSKITHILIVGGFHKDERKIIKTLNQLMIFISVQGKSLKPYQVCWFGSRIPKKQHIYILFINQFNQKFKCLIELIPVHDIRASVTRGHMLYTLTYNNHLHLIFLAYYCTLLPLFSSTWNWLAHTKFVTKRLFLNFTLL